MRRIIWATTMLCVCFCARVGFAADASTVHVKYASGATELDTLKVGTKLYSNRKYTVGEIPAELNGLIFTRRAGAQPVDVTLDMAVGARVYVMVDSDRGTEAKQKGGPELNHTLASSGWTRLADVQFSEKSMKTVLAVYVQAFKDQKGLTLKAGGFSGIVVAAKDVSVNGDSGPLKKQPEEAPPRLKLRADRASDDKPIAGPTTRVTNASTTIKGLAVEETGTGLLLGETTDVMLTITRGEMSKETMVQFVTPVGDDMKLARDEAMRYVHLSYPNWYVDSAEITFEDKYTPKDGGSIGTALTTMVLSAIQGFQIDPNIAITGDISANGKVRAIGGVSAKIHGAIASKCTLVAIPMENQDQLVDAVTYCGPSLVSDIQVIGISNTDDAVATVRTDRDAKLAQAISLFSEVQLNIKNVPGYLKKTEAREKLAQVLELAPQHLSARMLLDVITDKQPKTLSVTASRYYIYVAVRNMLSVIVERAQTHNRQEVPSGVVRIGLADLQKLMPLCDANVRPLITAWMRFIQCWNELQQGEGSEKEWETRRQALLDEMAKESTNADLMQKTLKEGM